MERSPEGAERLWTGCWKEVYKLRFKRALDFCLFHCWTKINEATLAPTWLGTDTNMTLLNKFNRLNISTVKNKM
jgi:hypothetical protein